MAWRSGWVGKGKAARWGLLYLLSAPVFRVRCCEWGGCWGPLGSPASFWAQFTKFCRLQIVKQSFWAWFVQTHPCLSVRCHNQLLHCFYFLKRKKNRQEWEHFLPPPHSHATVTLTKLTYYWKGRNLIMFAASIQNGDALWKVADRNSFL